MSQFHYQALLPVGADETPYRLLTTERVQTLDGPGGRNTGANLPARVEIKHVEVLEYEDLGMAAVWKVEVENFAAFVVVDGKGNESFAEVSRPVAFTIEKRPGRQ